MRVVAIVLGGGQGRRLFPLTRDRSKPAVPIGGKYRLVDIPISNSLHSGIREIYILTQFNSSSLNNHILNTYKFDYFSNSSVTLLAAEQTLSSEKWFQGTADAVRCHLPHYHLEPDDEVLILSGDHLYRMDFRLLIDYHRRQRADATISVIGVPEKEVHQFGILKSQESGAITDFVEKPKTPEARKGLEFGKNRYLASMGIYVFRASVLMELLKGTETDFGKELIPRAIKSCRAYAYEFQDYWRDIGTIGSFYEACIELTGAHPKFSFHSQKTGNIFTHPRFLPPTQLLDEAHLIRSLVSEGCILQNCEVSDSVVGLRSVIGKGAVISKSVIMGNDLYEENRRRGSVPIGIGEGTVIENAIVDKNARIGKKVVIKNQKNIKEFDAENFCIRESIVIIPKNATIPEGTVI